MPEKRKKEKSLKPSLRENKRYLLIEGDISKEDAEKAILDYIGILGYSKAGVAWISNKPLEKVSKNGMKPYILAVNRQEVDKVKAGLLLAGIKVKKVSGTLKGLKQKTLLQKVYILQVN